MALFDPKLYAVFTVAEDVKARVLAESDVAGVDPILAKVLEREHRERENYRLKGELKAKRHDILRVLTVRSFSVPESVKARLLAESDVAVLDRRLFRAVTAPTLDDVFRE